MEQRFNRSCLLPTLTSLQRQIVNSRSTGIHRLQPEPLRVRLGCRVLQTAARASLTSMRALAGCSDNDRRDVRLAITHPRNVRDADISTRCSEDPNSELDSF